MVSSGCAHARTSSPEIGGSCIGTLEIFRHVHTETNKKLFLSPCTPFPFFDRSWRRFASFSPSKPRENPTG